MLKRGTFGSVGAPGGQPPAATWPEQTPSGRPGGPGSVSLGGGRRRASTTMEFSRRAGGSGSRSPCWARCLPQWPPAWPWRATRPGPPFDNQVAGTPGGAQPDGTLQFVL
jgi:hypothetical protein